MNEPATCSACGDRVTGYALRFGARVGLYRCGATHCKRADSPLMRALRELPSAASRATEARVVILEKLLRERGVEPPP